jgi:aspartate/methionine/tyrosine aminotransferase
VVNAAKEAVERVDCNQYAPTQGRLRLRQAVSDAYSPHFGRTINPVDEIVITTGANEGMLSAFMGFVEEGDEVIVMEPYFDQYISNIEMAGGKVRAEGRKVGREEGREDGVDVRHRWSMSRCIRQRRAIPRCVRPPSGPWI